MLSRLPSALSCLALGLAIGASAGCGSDRPATASTPKSAASSPSAAGQQQPRPVKVVAASEVRVPRIVSVTGTLTAEDQIILSMKVTGRLAELAVDRGSAVRRGQVVARLDPVDFKLRLDQALAALHQARARLGLPPDGTDDRVDPENTALVRQGRAVLDEARLTRERTARLADQELVARAAVDSAVANEKVAEGRYQDAIEEVRNRQAVLAQRRSEVEQARQALADSELRAPADGMIRERRAAVGEYLTAGTPIALLVRVHPLRLVLSVPERAAAGVKVGQDVVVTLEGDPNRYHGRVARLSPAIQEQNRTLTVEAEVPNERGLLRPGAFAKAEIVIAEDQRAVFVPASSILVFAGIEKVMTVHEGKVVERRVQTGRRAGDTVEIVEGLKAGEPVITQPGNLVGGTAVAVTN